MRSWLTCNGLNLPKRYPSTAKRKAPSIVVLASIRTLVDYDWDAELRDYRENGGAEGHAFEHLVRIRNWLDGTNDSPVTLAEGDDDVTSR